MSQILNFGVPAPIDVQIVGPQTQKAQRYGERLLRQMREIPGIVDARMQQSSDYPQFDFQADRTRMAQYGLTEHDVTDAMATALAGTTTTAPNFWVDPKTGVSYPIVAQTPEYRLDTLSALEDLPVTPAGGGQAQVLGALGKLVRVRTAAVVTHYNVLPSVDLYASTQDRDLGAVAKDVAKLIASNRRTLPQGDTVVIRGEVATMNTAFSGLYLGIAGAILLVYLLIVVNFQSWLDPFIIITALPAALAGIVWALFATGTTLSVPALTGAIMCMGVATANSILVVSFARERLRGHRGPHPQRNRSGFRALPPSSDDSPRHDHRYGSYGAGSGRRRRAECPTGTCGDRRPGLCHRRHADLRAGRLQHRAWPRAGPATRARTGSQKGLCLMRYFIMQTPWLATLLSPAMCFRLRPLILMNVRGR